MKMTKRHLIKLIKNLFLAVFMLQTGVSYANWPTNPTDLEDGRTYYITSHASNTVVFHVDGDATQHTYLNDITIDGGKNVTIVFNTEHRLWLNGLIKVINGTLTLKLGDDYVPGTSTIARYPGQNSNPAYTGYLLQTDNSSTNVNACKLIIQGNSSNQFIISGDGTFTLNANDNNDVGYYNQPTLSGTVASSPLALFYGGTVDFDYVTLTQNINNSSVHGGAFLAQVKSPSAYPSASHNVIMMDNCVIENCYAHARGGAFHYYSGSKRDGHDSSVTMTDCVIRNCYTYSGSSGGTIRTIGISCCSLEMTRCQIYGNKSAAGSGAIGYYAVNVAEGIKLQECEIHDNWGDEGTVLITTNGTITGCTIRDNYSQHDGGGLSCRTAGTSDNRPNWTEVNGTVTLDEATVIKRNHAKGNGGGIYFFVQPIQITGGTKWTLYCNNEGKQYEHGLTIQGAKINDNKAGGNGGGIYIERNTDIYVSNLRCDYGELDGNTAGGDGGAIYVKSTLDANDGLLNDNHNHPFSYYETNANPPFLRTNLDVDFGGHSSEGHYMYVRSNSATTGNGGAAYIYGKKLVVNVKNGAVIGESGKANSATAGNGGAIFFDGILEGSTYGTFNMIGGSMNYNTAMGGSGGGLYANNGTVVLSGGDIQNNTATVSGGGIYVSSNANISVGAGAFDVQHNTVNGVPNNLYLPTDKTVEVVSGDFNPEYLGIYTQETATAAKRTKFPVFTVANVADSLYLRTIYNGMKNGTMNVIDDRQIHSAEYSHAVPNILYFGIGSPWSPYQQTVRKSTDLVDSNGDGVYEIGNIKQLTAFLWYVNGITTHDATFTPAVPGANGILTADINMENHYWMPFADYSGSFDGNGHVITGITMVPSNTSTGRGLFGTTASGADIKNVTLDDCAFYAPTSGACFVGSVVSDLAAGTVSSSVANPGVSLSASGNSSAILGGIAGNLGASGELHSSYSLASLTGYTMGGLAGNIESGGKLFNSYAIAQFTSSGGGSEGGLAGTNAGTVENCYVRGTNTLVGSNTGTVNYCYASGGSQTGTNGTFSATTATAYNYKERDNQVMASNIFVPTIANKQLVKTLNNWVNQDATHKAKYSGWLRPTTQTINDDYPLLRLPDYNAVAATSSSPTTLDYGDINTHLTSYTAVSQAICLYGSRENVNTNIGIGTNAPLYIDQDAVITQTGDIQAYVGVTLDNSAGNNGANPSFGGSDAIDWHFFSSVLKNSPIGLHYGDPGSPTEDNNPYNAYEYPDWHATFTNANGYFPINLNNYYDEWDLYAYCEPDYHWINLKRNSASHWHEDYPGINIPYTNDTEFVPGKGYMVALKDEGYLQAYGTLNTNTGVGSDSLSVPVTCTSSIGWTTREGHNLLGNPYQSYLDFDAFVRKNASLWNEGRDPFYIIIDEDNKDYVLYTVGQSPNPRQASRFLHPHQGFMIDSDVKGWARFDNGMRTTSTTTTGATPVTWDGGFRGGEDAPCYPLVNLMATDANGNRDIVTVELGRPDKGGALKQDAMHSGKGSLWCHYEGEDYAIAFTQPGLEYANIRFDCDEDGEYTMTWSTHNGEFSYLHLIDNMTGADIDCLSTSEYKFSARESDYNSRFRLVFDYTGIDDHEVPEPVEGPATFAYYANGEIHLTDADDDASLQIIDMTGRVIVSRDGVHTVSTTGLAAGVYVLRLTTANGTRIQKIILN